MDDTESPFGPDRIKTRPKRHESRQTTLSRLAHDLAYNPRSTVTAAQIAEVAEGPDLTPTGRVRKTKTDAEKKATAPFTTKYLKAWIKRNGGVVTSSERYDARTGRFHDAFKMMDAWALIRGETKVFQAGTSDPYEERDHLRKFQGVYGFQFAEEHRLTVVWVEFVRSKDDPVRVVCWVRRGVRSKGYSVEEVREKCGG